MRFDTWNVRRLYRAGSEIAREIAKYMLDLVGEQEVRLGRGGTKPAGDFIFFCGKGNEIMN
jgi:hypothetical protein